MVNHHGKPPILRTCFTFPSIQQANPRVWRRFLGYQYWLCTRFPSTSETEIDHFSVSGHSLPPYESKEHPPHVGLLLLDYLKHQKHEGWTKRNNIFMSFIQKKTGSLEEIYHSISFIAKPITTAQRAGFDTTKNDETCHGSFPAPNETNRILKGGWWFP